MKMNKAQYHLPNARVYNMNGILKGSREDEKPQEESSLDDL